MKHLAPATVTASPAPIARSEAPPRSTVRSRRPLPIELATALAAALTLCSTAAPAFAAHAGHDAQQEEMRHLSQVYWATHTPHGGSTTNSGTAVATFQVVNTAFQYNGGNTADILVGETVGWQWGSGFHTTTNGDPSDPNAGALWDAGMDPVDTYFEYTFNAAGTYPFFCRIHGSFMTGVVNVATATAVPPGTGEAGKIGFVSAPAPNPTRGRVAFRFGLAKAGKVQLRVLDTQGRLVALPIDDGFAAGTYSAVWDGRTRAAQPAKAGVYYLVLSVPGARQTRTIALQR